jgi:hypothetical protein
MKRSWFAEWGIVLIGIVLFAVFWIVCFINEDPIVNSRGFLQGVSALVSILGFLAVILAIVEYISSERGRRRTRTQETVKMAAEFMSKFYDAPELAEIKQHLREQTNYTRPPSNYSLRDDEVRLMNLFETLAIAVERDSLDIELVNRMLGTPLREMRRHPMLKTLLEDPKFSYEGITRVLLPRLEELDRKSAHKKGDG